MSQQVTNVSNEISVKTWEETYSYVVNKAVETMVKYLNLRGLRTDKLSRQRETLERGLWVWTAGRHIKKIVIEVYSTSDGKLQERFDITFGITDPDEVTESEKQDMQEKDFEYYWQEVQDALAEYDAPPDDVTYRFLVSVGPNSNGQDPPPVDGWGEGQLKDSSHLDKKEHGDLVDAGPVSATYGFWM